MKTTGRERRQRMLKGICAWILSVFALMTASLTLADSETPNASTKEIEQLIQAVEKSDCTFHRNGRDYSPEKAGDHLRLKLRRGAKYANTTEGFITNLASFSSWSGKPYHISCPGQANMEAKKWFDDQLELIRKD